MKQLPLQLSWERICLQYRKPGFDPWVGKIPQRRKWQPTPVSMPRKSHGQRSLVGCSPRGHKELGTTERLTLRSGWALLVAQLVKNPPAKQETWVWSLGWEYPLEEGMTTYSSLLPAESLGQRSLVGYSPQASKESDKTEATQQTGREQQGARL